MMRAVNRLATLAALMSAALASFVRELELMPTLGSDMLPLRDRPRRSKGKGIKRGKKAQRRHGAKMRPNMRHVSKRVRRKHRRATA